MRNTLTTISICLLVAACSSYAAAEDVNQLPESDAKMEIKVTPNNTNEYPSGSLSLKTLNHLPVGSSPVAAEVTIKSATDLLAAPVVVGNFVLFGEEQPSQGYTFDIKGHLNKEILFDLETGNALVTVTVKPTGDLPSAKVLELKSAIFEK